MEWTMSALSVVVSAGATLCVGIGIVALKKRPDPMAWPLAMLMFTGALWAIPHALSFGFTTVEQVAFWNKLVYPAASLVPVAYFVLGLRYAGYNRWLAWPVYAGLCAVPALTFALVWTNPAHGLFWESVAVEHVGNAATLDVTGGPLFWTNLLYSYALIALTWGVFASVVIHAGPLYRKQALLMLIGGIVPTGLNVVFNFGVGPLPPVDLTSSALAVSGLAFAVALFRYDLLGLTPAAYRSLPDLFADGVLVFDEEERLVEANDYAERTLETPLTVGTRASELFEQSLQTLDGAVISSGGANTHTRMYTLRYAPLRNQRRDLVGHALVMREVTDLKEHQQRLSVTNRVLRHNLRNELNIIIGVAEQLERTTTDGQTREALERLRAAANRLTDVSEKARHIQTSLRIDQQSLLAIDAAPIVERIVEQYQQQYPAAEVRYEGAHSAPVLAAGEQLLETMVRNVVENALEHHDCERPTIEVTVSTRGDNVTIQVADDGPGIPPEEVEVLDETAETQLQHGSSLGLWLTHWLASAMDGTLEFEENEPRGTVVTVRLQATDADERGETAVSVEPTS